jgi:hypothetical protein
MTRKSPPRSPTGKPVGKETPLARLVRRMTEVFGEYERATGNGGVRKTPPKSARRGH